MAEISKHDQNELTTEEMDTSKAEHLAQGIRPIIACIGTEEQYAGETSEIRNIKNVGHDVDYYEDPAKLHKRNYKNAGKQTYVISEIDNMPKFTEELHDCTGLVAVGKEKTSGMELSFITHEDPTEFLSAARVAFLRDLRTTLNELKERCSKGSVDIVITGGAFSWRR